MRASGEWEVHRDGPDSLSRPHGYHERVPWLVVSDTVAVGRAPDVVIVAPSSLRRERSHLARRVCSSAHSEADRG